MSQYSIALNNEWRLRVLAGPMAGKEFALAPGRYVLGSDASASILVRETGVLGHHLCLDVTSSSAVISGAAGAKFIHNGRQVQTATVTPGDRVCVGTFEFQIINPARAAQAAAQPPIMQKMGLLPPGLALGLVVLAIAAALFLLLVVTGNPNLVPVTLMAMSAVVPSVVATYVVRKHDQTGISFRTLAVTFLLGGSVGIVCTMLFGMLGAAFTAGLLALPLFAGLYEEPAKLIATAWRWKHPAYDRPMDGLIIGMLSGFGFAVFETAGYGFTNLMRGGLDPLLHVMVLRGILSPFGHGLWCGILSAAFWQAGRAIGPAFRDKRFRQTLLIVIALHALWNSPLGLIGPVFSGLVTLWLFRSRLMKKGYA